MGKRTAFSTLGATAASIAVVFAWPQLTQKAVPSGQGPTFIQLLRVSDSYSFTAQSAAESTSAVIPPGKKTQCPGGRILFVQDGLKSQENGTVVYRNLNDPSGTVGYSTFDPLPDKFVAAANTGTMMIGSNDHDLVALSNGDVLCIWMGRSRARPPRAQMPAWFEEITKDGFGPGARSCIYIWRSTNGGGHFTYLTKLDPLLLEDGSGAMPQFRRDENGTIIQEKPYLMGGTDGPIATVDAKTDRITLSLPIVGYRQAYLSTPEFKLSTESQNKTLILTSDSRGDVWASRGFAPGRQWRGPAISTGPNEIVMAQRTELIRAQIGSSGKISCTNLGGTGVPYNFNKDEIPEDWWVFPGLRTKTFVARCPGTNDILLSYPSTLPVKKHGHRVYLYRRATADFVELDPILPATTSPNNYVYHVGAIDLGSGPVLLYWHSMNYASKTYSVWGRLIFGPNEWSKDFAVSRAAGKLESYTINGNYWLGHYQNSDGYAALNTKGGPTYNYFPIWNTPNGKLRFANVIWFKASFAKPKLQVGTGLPDTIRKSSMQRIPAKRPDLQRRAATFREPWDGDDG